MEPSTFELDTLPYSALLEALSRERASCTVRVTDGVFDGEVRVQDGTVVSATFGTLQGGGALMAIAIADPLRYTLIREPGPILITRVPRLVDAKSDATLLGLGAPFDLEQAQKADPSSETPALQSATPATLEQPSAAPQLLPLITPPPPLPAGPLEAEDDRNELKSWAARASQQLGMSSEHSTDRPSQTPSPNGLARETDWDTWPVDAQPTIRPAVFARDRTLWIALALALPLLAFGLFRLVAHRGSAAAPSVAVSQPAAVTNASPSPVLPPMLKAGTPPSTLVAPVGSLAPTVVLRVLVGTDGSVKQVAVQSPRPGLGPLEKQAMESVRGLRFQPATQGGKLIEHWTTLPVPFHTAVGTRVLTVKGSETIGAALGPDWARGMEKAQPGLKIQIDALGSSTGFAGLLDGSASIAMSSRPIRPDELSFAERLGVQLRELIVAYDGIAVIVHPDNPVRTLDMDGLAQVFAQRVARWNQLSNGVDAPIHVLGRPAYSGTHSFLRERMLAALGPGGGFGAAVESVEAPSEIVARVARDVNAIGYVSIGQLDPSVRALWLAPGRNEQAIAATHEAIRDSSYPIARPLYLYLRADSEHDARALADYALSPEGQTAVEKNGFVPVQSPLTSSLATEIPATHVTLPELRRIYFRPNSAAIESDSRLDLASAGADLRAGKRALVVGHADSAGKSEHNEQLARRRADAVARELRRLGAQAGTVDVEIAAASHPLASNATADGRKANRRVDLILQSR